MLFFLVMATNTLEVVYCYMRVTTRTVSQITKRCPTHTALLIISLEKGLNMIILLDAHPGAI